MQFPNIDRELALKQLQLLGYQQEDKVYLRFFYPSSDSRKDGDKGRKSNRLNWYEVETYQRQGRGVYFVINGGGHKNEDVQIGRAVFIEHDNLDKEIQLNLWKTIGLPEPSFQIDTGGKSIHSYWVFNEPIAVDKWCELQKDLLEFTEADRSIKNSARVMRLAGAWHISIDESGQPIYNQTRIVAESGHKYSYEELRDSIPLSSGNIKGLETVLGVSPVAPHTSFSFSIPLTPSVPLEICLAKESRHLLNNGAPQGERNTGGAKLARDLIGTYNYLRSIGQSVEGEPRSLLDHYANRCSPSLPAREVDSIWKSAEQAHPTPSCGPIGVENCLRGWYIRTIHKERLLHLKSKFKNLLSATVTGDTAISSDSPNSDPLSLSATVTTVTTLLKSGLKDYEERHQLEQILARSVVSKATFWELVNTIRCELDEVQAEDTQRLNQLIDWHNATLNFNQVLPPILAQTFLHDAAILNIDPISLWQYFLPAIFSLIGKRVNLDVESHSIPAILWTCLVSESGTGKTRAENIILTPLKEQQHTERKRWEQEMKEYNLLLKTTPKDAPPPPSPRPERKYLFEVATIQAVMRRLSEQNDNGSIWARDEISGLFKSLGQFSKRNNENEGLECLLKMWDGAGSFVERMNAEDDSYAVLETRLNIAGGIQPGAFRQAFQDPNDPQGLQARFLYAVPTIYPAQRVKGYCELSELLPPLYNWLDNCPRGMIKLSYEADLRYTDLVKQIGAQAERESAGAVRAWMRKLPTQLLRIALGLHLVEFYYDRNRNFWQLERDTLERAVEVCRYYRSAFQVVQEKAADSDSTSSILLKIWDMAVTQPDGVTPRDIYRNVKAVTRRAYSVGRQVTAYTLELLSQLVQMGKGKLEKNGRLYRFFASVEPTGEDERTRDWGLGTREEKRETGETEENPPSPPTLPSLPSPPSSSPSDVTVVTVAQSYMEQTLEASPKTSVSPVTLNSETTALPEEQINSISDSEEDIQWLLQFLADLEFTPVPHPRFISNEQLMELFDELEHRAALSLEPLQQTCPDYLTRMVQAFDVVSEALFTVETSPSPVVSVVESQASISNPSLDLIDNGVDLAIAQPLTQTEEAIQPTESIALPQTSTENGGTADLKPTSDSHIKPSSQEITTLEQIQPPTLAELQALLLACQNLVELKQLKKKQGHRLNEAYRALGVKQQQQIDGISATAIPYEVFKYTGTTIERNGQKLTSGALVYIEPNAKVGKTRSIVPVWLLRAMDLGWQRAIDVSRDCLLLVEKAVSDVVDLNIEQPPLFD